VRRYPIREVEYITAKLESSVRRASLFSRVTWNGLLVTKRQRLKASLAIFLRFPFSRARLPSPETAVTSAEIAGGFSVSGGIGSSVSDSGAVKDPDCFLKKSTRSTILWSNPDNETRGIGDRPGRHEGAGGGD
jgi:hypothetical protein